MGLQGRRRALGNIQFIGHLYKKKMLTEKIMHSCIQTLLDDVRPAPFNCPPYFVNTMYLCLLLLCICCVASECCASCLAAMGLTLAEW